MDNSQVILLVGEQLCYSLYCNSLCILNLPGQQCCSVVLETEGPLQAQCDIYRLLQYQLNGGINSDILAC